MRAQLGRAVAAACVVLLFAAVPAHAQGGTGWGAKIGPIFSSFGAARANLPSFHADTSTSLEGGLFIGGNRGGKYGAQLELLYAKKVLKENSIPTTLHYFQIPFLVRFNGGSLDRSGLSYYGVVGEALAINLKASLQGLNVKDNYKGIDLGLIGGGGIEYNRFIAEARYDWGLFNVRSATVGNRVRTKAFVIMAGYRIH
jgi:hypothetical protein